MDGIHDLGGREGFGPVEVDEVEEPFHEPWEGRVRGMVTAMSRPAGWSIDWFRHCRELIDPVDYLTRPYFDQWVQAYAAMLVNAGVASVEEVSSGHATSPGPDVRKPMTAADVARIKPGATRFDRDVDDAPAFAIGDRVRAKAHGTAGHTRLPAYVRGRAGTIEAHHGAHVLPDASARGEERAEALYTVGFDAAELWPAAEGRNDRVSLNLWESYLDRV